jgi:aminopeptidase N
MPLSQNKFNALNNLSTYLAAIKNVEKIKWGVDEIVKFRDAIPESIQGQTNPYINGMLLKSLLASKSEALKKDAQNAGLIELVNYIKSKLPEEDKKGF